MAETDAPLARNREESGSHADDDGNLERDEPSSGSRTPASSREPARPASQEHGSSHDDLVSAEDVVESPALRRSNSLLFLVPALCCSLMALVELVSGDYATMLVSYVFLVISAVVAWLAFVLRDRGHHALWAAAVTFCALNIVLPVAGELQAAAALSSVLVMLTWATILVRPQWLTLLAGYALVSLFTWGGGEPSLSIGLHTESNSYPLPVTIVFLLVPIGLGVALHHRQRTLDGKIRAAIGELEHEREELAIKLQSKMDELELSREQLFEAQKLKTVGTMASGLAHELNNILTPIRGHAELIAEGVSNPDQTRRYGQRILDSAAAAASITGALLTYTRQGTFQPVRSNLRQLLQAQILPVLSKSLPGNVRLKVDLARNVSVDVDRVLFQQAIANLVFNAVDAMPEGGEITISLATSSRSPKEDKDSEIEDISRDDTQRSAVVTVADTGTGIDTEHIEQIFDPFFTTKAVGSGSGLGLAMVMGTVTRHHGRVLVESELGAGTTFTLLLPLAAAEDKKEGSHKPWPVLGGDGKGPVVVVLTDDQDALDEFEELLEATECKPICTSDVKGATPLLTEMGDKVDLLILDLELEGADAARLFKTVRELFPEMPVILLSDQPTDPTVQRMIGAGPTRSVRKPMDGRLFSAMLTDLLHPGEGYVRDFTPVPINLGADVSGPHPRAG